MPRSDFYLSIYESLPYVIQPDIVTSRNPGGRGETSVTSYIAYRGTRANNPLTVALLSFR